MPCGLDICFHQTTHLEVRDSQFSDLLFKRFDHSYRIICCSEYKRLFAEKPAAAAAADASSICKAISEKIEYQPWDCIFEQNRLIMTVGSWTVGWTLKRGYWRNVAMKSSQTKYSVTVGRLRKEGFTVCACRGGYKPKALVKSMSQSMI